MKNMTKALALALAVMLFAALFAACSGKDQPAPTEAPAENTSAPAEAATEVPTEAPTEVPTEVPTEEPTQEPDQSGANDNDKLVGVWETNINIAEQVESGLESDETGMFAGVELSDAYFKLILTFNDDGSYTFEADMDTYKEAMSQIVSEIVPVLKEYMVAILSLFAEEGQELSEEEMLAMLEISSWDELGEQMLGEIDENEEEMSSSGTYELKDNTLRMTDDDGYDTTVASVSVSANTFTIEEVDAQEGDLLSDTIMPMVFNRIG